jgi:hypothetical protein
LVLCLVGAAVAQRDCPGYCANITATCMGPLGQFPVPDSLGLCMSSCMYYPLNASLDTGGDSYQCRIYHLSVANQSASNAMTHCPHAGFNGGPGVCGSFCESYCDSMMGACNGSNAAFTSRAFCMQECSYYPRNMNFLPNSSATPADNSIDCRAWHSQVAVANSPNVHCFHAAPQGGQFCGSACENYCDNVMAVCTSGLMQWKDRTQCLTACASWPLQNNTNDPLAPVTMGNSLPCRKYHAFVSGQSMDNAKIHCIHTGPLGGSGTCGSACEGYCTLLGKTCAGVVMSDCLAMCSANMTASDTVTTANIIAGKVKMGSVGCATYYTLKATTDASMCPMAMDGMGSACSEGAAALLQASWSLIAVLLLALGLSS